MTTSIDHDDMDRKRMPSTMTEEGYCWTYLNTLNMSNGVQFRFRRPNSKNRNSIVSGISPSRAMSPRIQSDLTSDSTHIQLETSFSDFEKECFEWNEKSLSVEVSSTLTQSQTTNEAMNVISTFSGEIEIMSSSDEESFETAVSRLPSSSDQCKGIITDSKRPFEFDSNGRLESFQPISDKQNSNRGILHEGRETTLESNLFPQKQNPSPTEQQDGISIMQNSHLKSQKSIVPKKNPPTQSPSMSESSHSEDTIRLSNLASVNKNASKCLGAPALDQPKQESSPIHETQSNRAVAFSNSSSCSDRSSLETHWSDGYHLDDSPFHEKSISVSFSKLQLLESPYTMMSPINASSEMFSDDLSSAQDVPKEIVNENIIFLENQGDQSRTRHVRFHPTTLSRSPFTPIAGYNPNITEESPTSSFFQMMEESPQILLELSDIESNIEVKDMRRRRHRQELYEKHTSPLSESSTQSDVNLNNSTPKSNDVILNIQEKQDSLGDNHSDGSHVLRFETTDYQDTDLNQAMIGRKSHDEINQSCSDNIEREFSNGSPTMLFNKKTHSDSNKILHSIDEEFCGDDESSLERNYKTLKFAFHKLLKEKQELQNRLAGMTTPYEDRVTPFRDIFEQNRCIKVANEQLMLRNQHIEAENNILRNQKEQVDLMISQLQQQTMGAVNLAVQQSTQLKQKLTLAESRIRDLEVQLMHVEEANISLDV
jgi:hypothetical protein